MQMAGSVCSFAYNYHFLHLHLAFDKCFGKCFLLSFYQEHMNYILIWTGTYHHHLVPPLLIVLWRHILWRPVPSPYNVDLVWSGIRQSLSTCGGIYNYRTEVVGGEGTLGSGGGGPIWKEVLVLESYQYSYIFILLLQYLQYPEPEGLYVNIYYSSGTYSDRSDVEEFLSWKWWLWWVLVETLQSGLYHLIWEFLSSQIPVTS